jgi:hypothetical protein
LLGCREEPTPYRMPPPSLAGSSQLVRPNNMYFHDPELLHVPALYREVLLQF